MAISFIYKSLNQSYRKSQGIWTLKCLPVFNDKVSSSIETMINAMTRSCDRNDPKGMFILFLSIISIYSKKKKQSALKINRKKETNCSMSTRHRNGLNTCLIDWGFWSRWAYSTLIGTASCLFQLDDEINPSSEGKF